jgi:glycerol-3-phosphate dehydrogenase
MIAPGSPADLRRNPELAAAGTYDLAIVGGGIQGATLALEAARRGLSTLLLERGDFGGATSWNSLRILHGGLRYLQGLDLRRFRESVGERGWFLREFPDLAAPLPCLMPLYDPPRGGALRRPLPLRAALTADALLRGAQDPGLPPSRLLTPRETAERFPGVGSAGLGRLLGGALWHDAVAPDSQRLVIEILRWAAACGARALNYAEALDLRLSPGGSRVVGLRAEDRVTGARLLFDARAVINGAGPWCRQVARRFDRDVPGLFRPVLAWNVLLDREPPAPLAIAAAAPGQPGSPQAQTFFVLPWKGRTLAGTAYAAPTAEPVDPAQGAPGPEAVRSFLAALNAALPALDARFEQVLRVFWGWLPGQPGQPEVPATQPVVCDHGRHGGPRGLVSVSGVKLTTARALAVRALKTAFQGELPAPRPVPRPAADAPWSFDELVHRAEHDPDAARDHLRGLAERQAVVHLEDLLLRRTDWGILPAHAALAERLCQTLGWAPDETAPLRAAGGLP